MNAKRRNRASHSWFAGRLVVALCAAGLLAAAAVAPAQEEAPRRERTGLRRPVLRLLREQIREFVAETVQPVDEAAGASESPVPLAAAPAAAPIAASPEPTLADAAPVSEPPRERVATRTRDAVTVAASPQGDEIDVLLDEALAAAREQNAHPLTPAIALAKYGVHYIDENVDDYVCRLVKTERYNGSLKAVEHIDLKFRHKPFSVYMNFLAPEESKGQEALYVEGRYGGKLLGHAGSGFRARFGTVELKPDGAIAMAGQRYPITRVGMRNLLLRLIEVAEIDSQRDECDVKYFRKAKMDGRPCLCIQVEHPHQRDYFRFHLARIFIDRELQLPVRYESYLWPDQPGGDPQLIERYSYTGVQVNVGLTDADFDRDNPAYRF